VGSVQLLDELKAYAEGEGLSVAALHLRGKVHNPENGDLSKELCAVCDEVPSLQLPGSANLQVPVRSNKTGAILSGVSLTHEVVETALVARCEWYTLLIELSKELHETANREHTFAMFGTGRKNCLPLMPFEERRLDIKKLDIVSYVDKLQIPREIPSLSSFPGDAIAVVGAACRLPGANSLEELWDLICAGSSRVEDLPPARFDPRLISRGQDTKRGTELKLYGNFIDDVEAFDNAFFGISPRESTYMDPQQRLLLETAYQALDSSGYLRSHCREDFDNVGCFIGASYTEYLENTSSYSPTAYTATGTIRAFQSGKISYHFGWSGPSEVIDTACSSSLVAIHRACRAIQYGECPIALAGGVNIITGCHNYLDLGKAGFLSPSGQCKPFDIAADGYCRADGVGLVVLKSLSKAIADGDDVLGVIPGVATNHGGLSSAITVPYSRAQIDLFKNILDRAGINPSQVSYVEAHGTGTQVGDPIEVASVREVFGGPQRNASLHIGSLKANIGHSETAAGIGSLLKVLAMIRHGKIPPLAGFQNLNSKIPALEPDHLRINSEVIPWDAPFRVAFVNSYGAAGSNSALVCCEPPRQTSMTYNSHSSYPIFISAATSESLKMYAAKVVAYIRKAMVENSLSVANLAFTLHERRKHHRVRWVGTEHELSSLSQSLETDLDKTFEVNSPAKSVVLVFSGQSKQTIQLDESWYRVFPRFRFYLDRCTEILTRLGYTGITPIVFQSESVSDVVALQCGTFAVQYAFAKCWMDAGLKVDSVIGHSFGELTALAISGILSLEDAIKLIACRASLMDTKWGSERGTMLSIHGTCEVVREIIAIVNTDNSGKGLEIACFNGPKSQVVVGTRSDIERAEMIMDQEPQFHAIHHQRVNVTHGFHSVFTDTILEDLSIMSKSLTFNKPTVPLETCTENPVDSLTSDRIVQHTRLPVFFSDAISRLEQRLGPTVWVEAGTNSPIISMARKAVRHPSAHTFLAMKSNGNPDAHYMISNATVALWREGISTSFWSFLTPDESGLKQVWLPPYEFQRSRHWLKYVDPVIHAGEALKQHPSKLDVPQAVVSAKLVSPRDRVTKSWSSLTFTVHAETNRFTNIVSGHAVRNNPLCPASMYMECVVMAAQMIEPAISVKAFNFHNLSFPAALGINYSRDVSLTLEGAGEYLSWNFTVQSTLKQNSKARSTTHAKGRFSIASQSDFQLYERIIADRMNDLIADPRSEKFMARSAYTLFSRVVRYAENLRGISQVTILNNQAVAKIRRPPETVSSTESTAAQVCDAISLDTFIQVVGLLINSSDSCPEDEVFIATHIDSIVIQHCDFSNCNSWTVYAMSTPRGNSQVGGDMFVFTNEGKLIMTGSGVQFTKYPIVKLEKLLGTLSVNSAPEPAKQTIVPATQPCPLTNDLNGVSMDAEAKTKLDCEDLDTQTIVALDPLPARVSPPVFLNSTGIQDNEMLGKLGFDSLSGFEFVSRLRSQLGRETSKDTLHSFAASNTQLMRSEVIDSESTQLDKFDLPNGVVRSSLDDKAADPQLTMRSRQRILELVFENCGEPVNDIEDGASLQDIGIDSLSLIELNGSLEESFGIRFGDENLNLQSTVKEILEYIHSA
jgi:acyl transferase domain-containing protein/acyl carrier protein